MAKGRSAKAKASSEEGTEEGTKEATKKVSDAQEPTLVPNGGEEDEGEEDKGEELWDLVEVLAGGSRDELCRTDGCEQVAVATWANNVNPDDKWPLCETCQDDDFGGWPEVFEHHATSSKDANANESSTAENLETPTTERDAEEATSMDVDEKEPMVKSKDVESDDSTPKESNNTTNDNDANYSDADDQGEEEEETWDLKKILSCEAVTKSAYIKCCTKKCKLAACCLYVSSAGEKWYTCIDCQENDYGGWPPVEELPITLTKDHVQALVDKCSKNKRPAMPPFADSDSPNKRNANRTATNPITPLTGTAKQAPKGSKTTITPTPAKATKTKKNPKENAVFLKKHAEWQAAAIKATGDPNVRIVVSKPEAKPLIFNVLYDAFKPMNITQIYTELKATVPSSILKMCLDDMALDNNENQFYDSDDEDDAPKKAKKPSEASGDEFAGSLCFKGGRNANSTLYYVDHTKQKNNGNGLEPDQRNALASDLAQAQEEESVLKAKLQNITKETEQLLSEPTNEEMTATLEVQGAEMNGIRDQLEAARKLKCNEKTKKSIKKRIDSLAAQWRKRKRLTMEFLISLEETSEGSISAKKCLGGDGQIDIESDETAIKNAITYGKKRRSMASRPPAKKMKVSQCLGKTTGQAEQSLTSGLTADSNLVAVRLDASGQVVRVYLGDDE